MLFYRMLKKDEPATIEPVTLRYDLIDLVYSNSMPSRSLFKEERHVWSFAKTPEAALSWLGPRGKGKYDRLAYYDFATSDGMLLDLTELKTWIGLIEASKRLFINNLNIKTSVCAINCIVPSMKSAYSMARACQEVAFIPTRGKGIALNIIDHSDIQFIPRNQAGTPDVLTRVSYNNDIIDLLLAQLEMYNIRPVLKNALEKLKVA